MRNLKLDRSPSRKRLQSLTTGPEPLLVKSNEGQFGAGLLQSVSAITKGEALGHGMWVDEVFVAQVADALSAAERGTKSRFTHPGLSADGLAKGLGLAVGGRVEGSQVLTDLHFYASAHRSPDGDLAGYVIERSAEDPFHFGTSIVFDSDATAEDEFMLANGGRWEEIDDGWEIWRVIVDFKSPDPLNVDNLPHCRLSKLYAVDIVDDPAANPGGMFHRDLSTIDAAQGFLDYILGFSRKKPSGLEFDIDPDRARLFFQRYAAQRGISFTNQKDPSMKKILKHGTSFTETTTDDPTRPPTEQAADTVTDPNAVTCPECGAVFVPDNPADPKPIGEADPAAYAANHRRYTEAFGEVNGSKWFLEGKSFGDSQTLHYQAQLAAKDAEITRLQTELSDAKQRLAAVAKDGATPLGASTPAPGTEGGSGEKSSGVQFFRKGASPTTKPA